MRERLPKYHELGARFAKWRAVIDIGAGIPSYTAIHANAHALARYAALCQEDEIVPIVEPEVLMDGDHDIDRCYEVTEWVLKETFQELYYQPRRAGRHGAEAEHGDRRARRARSRASVEEVAEKTVKLLKACVPAAVPGIAFLSGGQSDEDATAHLDAMNTIGDLPWKLTFSYGRALQAAPQKAWGGKAENVAAGAARLRASRADERPCEHSASGSPISKRRRPDRLNHGAASRTSRPKPRLYLATPPLTERRRLRRSLPKRIKDVDIAAVLLRLAEATTPRCCESIAALAPPVQKDGRGAAASTATRRRAAQQRRRRPCFRSRRTQSHARALQARPHRRLRRTAVAP